MPYGVTITSPTSAETARVDGPRPGLRRKGLPPVLLDGLRQPLPWRTGRCVSVPSSACSRTALKAAVYGVPAPPPPVLLAFLFATEETYLATFAMSDLDS